jgi:hypothetical protein
MSKSVRLLDELWDALFVMYSFTMYIVIHFQAKLRERERETHKGKEREEQEMERVKLKIHRKEAVSSYQALLVEMIKDPKVFCITC